MKLDSEEWRTLRSQFIEAAANYENAGYRTFIERTVRGEEYYLNHRYDRVAEIKWPYRPWRKCWILAPSSGTNEEPFAVMKTLFTKAWLRLPIVVAGRIVDAAVWQLSPRDDVGLLWARSHYELWCWLLWFDWLWRCGEDETEEPEFPPAGMDLQPFSSSVSLIGRWGLDGGDGTLPEWLSPKLPLDADSEPVANPKGKGDSADGSAMRSSTKLPLISNNVHVGMVEVSGLTKLCNSLDQQRKRQETLYRDEAGRFIYHILDNDDESVGRTCVLVRPADAYEIAKNADELHVDRVELFTEFDELLKQIAKEREAAFDDALLGYADSNWKRDDTLNNKAWRVRRKKQTGELFGDDASERGWYQSKTGEQVIKKDNKGVWVYLTASHSAKLKEFFSAFVA